MNSATKENSVDCEVVGIRKGHIYIYIYDLGSDSSLFARRRNYHCSSSSSTEWVQRHEFEELKFEMDELRGMVKQLMESLNFQPKPYTRDQVDEYDAVDDNEDVADNNDDNEDDNDESLSFPLIVLPYHEVHPFQISVLQIHVFAPIQLKRNLNNGNFAGLQIKKIHSQYHIYMSFPYSYNLSPRYFL
ncbi:hypothetical protein P8452_72464 [Trifolium repens]|nr:hypothetical protein P8452_72464 [Trifolium repens]